MSTSTRVPGRVAGTGSGPARASLPPPTPRLPLPPGPATGPSGGNWLGPDAITPPHPSRDFAVPPGQEYYLRAHSCNRNIMDEQRRIPITTDIYTWTISEP